YHPRTARLYTDFGLLTADDKICEDVNEVFKQLTGLGRARRLHHLWISPFSLHERVLAAIKREANHARAGKPGYIIAKMNALIEPKVIETLYRASQAGVKIDLIVRGVCSLRPGIPGLSENMRVRSVIGRFLEHSRIFYFLNGGEDDLYLSSADWMGRNFFGANRVVLPGPRPQDQGARHPGRPQALFVRQQPGLGNGLRRQLPRSEEHTSELQSRFDLVCRLLLEKKKKKVIQIHKKQKQCKHVTNERQIPISLSLT